MRRGASLVAIVLLLGVLAGCGDDLEPDPGVARSGTRLALVRYVFDDRTAHVETRWFHDRVLDAPCTPARWSDGNVYCTPAAGGTVYVEGTCTLARGQVVPVEGVPTEVPRFFLRRFALGDERLPSRLFRGGELVEPPAQLWELRNGVCTGPLSPGVVADYYALLPPVEPVRVRTHEVLVTDALALDVYAAEDGLRAPAAWHDRGLASVCRIEPEPGSAAIATCVPETAAETMYFHDGGCSIPEHALATASTPPPFVRARDPRTGCATHHALDREVEAPPLYFYAGASCLPVVAPLAHAFYLLGPALELPRLARTRVDVDGARLQPIVLGAGEVHAPARELYDTALATECRPAEHAGAIRCLPVSTAEVASYFRDDQCQLAISLATVLGATCMDPPRFAQTAGGATLHAIEAPQTGPLYHLSTGDRCLRFDPSAKVTLHAIGPALTTELATADLVVDD